MLNYGKHSLYVCSTTNSLFNLFEEQVFFGEIVFKLKDFSLNLEVF